MSIRPSIATADEILGGYFPVLDHGFVALIDYMGTDESVEAAARISYGHGTRKRSATRGLIRYLRRHLHTTPSEMVELKFHCAMPIFVARQFVRHRMASINEYSARYSLLPLKFYTPEQDQFSLQSKTNNQGREDSGTDESTYHEATSRWKRTRWRASTTYEWLTDNDVARELARIDLPLSIYTQWYWKIDLHNLLHFLTLRCDGHAQWEIRQFANVMAGMVKRVAPFSYEAWIDYQHMGERFSRMEIKALRYVVEVTGSGVWPNGTAGRTNAELGNLGLSPREVREFKAKLGPCPKPDHELDLSLMRSAETVRAETNIPPEVLTPKEDT